MLSRYRNEVAEVLDREQEQALWAAYYADPTIERRNELVMQYEPFAIRMAEAVFNKTATRFLSLDDMQSVAIEGLIAIVESQRFDLSANARFITFASQRMRGFIIDRLRELDWVPRLARVRQKQGVAPVSMSHVDQWEGSRQQEHHSILNGPDPRQELPSANMERADVWRVCLKSCDKRERLILILYYRENLLLREIAGHFGLSESRVSQILGLTLRRLRSLLTHA